MATSLTQEWTGHDVTLGEVEAELARLRDASAVEGGNPNQRTSVMTHVAWVPPEWLDAAERTLEGLAERHPSRTVILVPCAEESEARLDAEVSVRCFPAGDHAVCGEVIELRLCGSRAAAPASIVLPLVISDLPVFLRWRGEPPFGEPQWEQLVDVADRVIVDSSEWPDLPAAYAELAQVFERVAASDIAWARTPAGRRPLARLCRGERGPDGGAQGGARRSPPRFACPRGGGRAASRDGPQGGEGSFPWTGRGAGRPGVGSKCQRPALRRAGRIRARPDLRRSLRSRRTGLRLALARGRCTVYVCVRLQHAC